MKKTVGILFGGKSTEHEISIISARNVFTNLDKEKFNPFLVFIDKTGGWYESNETLLFGNEIVPEKEDLLSLCLHGGKFYFYKESEPQKTVFPNAIFPVLHGPNGEDGSIQGLLEAAGIPYVGPGILGSSVSMDKEITKKLLKEAGIPIARYICLHSWQKNDIDTDLIIKELGSPLVVKPSNAGSSVGLSKAKNGTELKKAIKLAFEYDHKILVEEYIKGREIEVAVLGNETIIASVPGEIISEFYDYHEKYSSLSKAGLKAPAELDSKQIKTAQNIAIRAFETLQCTGMSRVDFFLANNKFLVNEINTIPGFTNISMYPRLFELSGIPQKDLITKLIDLAIEKHEKDEGLKTIYEEKA